jgi:hypothetical protein
MKRIFFVTCFVFSFTALADEVKVNASNEDLKQMATVEKRRADQAEMKAQNGTKSAEAKKQKDHGDQK